MNIPGMTRVSCRADTVPRIRKPYPQNELWLAGAGIASAGLTWSNHVRLRGVANEVMVSFVQRWQNRCYAS